MKPEFNKKYTTIALYAFLVIAAGICFWAVLDHLGAIGEVFSKIYSVLIPFVNGFVIAYLINPVVKVCEQHLSFVNKKNPEKKLRRALSILLAFIIVFAFLTLFIVLAVPQIGQSIKLFSYQIQQWAPKAYAGIQGFLQNTQYEIYITESLTNMINSVVNLALSYSGDSLAAVYFGVMNLATGILNLVFGFIISIYMLYDKEKFIRQGKMLVKALFSKGHAEKIINISSYAHQLFSGFIVAKIVTSVILGVLCTVCMWIFRMPFAELIGFIIGASNLIPYFGTWIGGAICALMIMVVNPVMALWFVVLVLVLQQIDNSIISPKIIGDSTGVSAFWTMFAILVGGGFFGIAGMIIGVPVFALIYSLFAAYIREKSK